MAGKHDPDFEKQLLAYAIAAGAMVFAPSAHASIVYTQTNVGISSGVLQIDLNNDGINDFELTDSFRGGSFDSWRLRVGGDGNPGAGVVAKTGRATPLASGFSIGPGDAFGKVQARSLSMAYAHCRCMSSESFKVGGSWANVSNKYLGFRFQINGQVHYGWARISVKANSHNPSVMALLTGYAYETTPNMAIAAGDQGPKTSQLDGPSAGTLAQLSRGTLGLQVWRKEQDLA